MSYNVLLAILGDDVAVWFYVRINALRALAELCRIIPKAAFSLVEPKTFSSLRNINKKRMYLVNLFTINPIYWLRKNKKNIVGIALSLSLIDTCTLKFLSGTWPVWFMWLSTDKDTPIEAQRLAVQCYINLQNYHVSLKAMLNGEFMTELLSIMQVIESVI